MISIFNRAITGEPSYTRLLYNLMIRFPLFRDELLGLLLSEDDSDKQKWSGQIRLSEIHPEGLLPNGCGRPDLRISNPALTALVEVKTKPNRGFTDNQRLDKDADSYIQYLKESPGERRYVFLVPMGWKRRSELIGLRDKQAEDCQRHNIQVVIRYWEEILALLKDSALVDPLLQEFKTFLEEDFQVIAFDNKEFRMMKSGDFPGQFQAVRGLELLIDSLMGKISSKDYKPLAWGDRNEYGFLITRGNREGLLWVGSWMLAMKECGAQLCYGVEEDSRKFHPAVVNEFARLCPEHKAIGEPGARWLIGKVPDKIVFSGEAATMDRLWKYLSPIVAALNEAARKVST
jgi:hypothetical protein